MKTGMDGQMRRLVPVFCSLAIALLMLVLSGDKRAQAEDSHTPLQPITCPSERLDNETPECFILHVPSDWRDLSNRPMELPVMRFAPLEGKATKPPLLVLAGGPGQSVIFLEKEIANNLKLFRDHREIILMDQRGTGPLAGDALCASSVEESGQISLEALVTCVGEAEANGQFLSDYTTAFAAEDYHALRNALQIDKWAILANSYGARVAQSLLRIDEKGIDRIIFNGPLFEGTLFFDWNPFAFVEQAIELCNEKDECRERYPDLYWDFQRLPFDMREARLPEGAHPAILQIFLYRNRLQALMARHDMQSIPADITRTALDLKQAIAEDQIWTPPPTLAPSMKGLGLMMHFAILCPEDIVPMGDTPLQELDQPLQVAFYRNACKQIGDVSKHPVTLPDTRQSSAKSSKPVLILNGAFDTVVDPSEAQKALDLYRNGRWINMPFAGHDQVSQVPCARNLAVQFLDGKEAGQLDDRCVSERSLRFKPLESLAALIQN